VGLAIEERELELVARLEGGGAAVPGWVTPTRSRAFPGRFTGSSPNLDRLLSRVSYLFTFLLTLLFCSKFLLKLYFFSSFVFPFPLSLSKNRSDHSINGKTLCVKNYK
jgi:hypothetical protein